MISITWQAQSYSIILWMINPMAYLRSAFIEWNDMVVEQYQDSWQLDQWYHFSESAMAKSLSFSLSSLKALSMSSLLLAPVKTTLPEPKTSTDLMVLRFLQTMPGKFSLRTTFFSRLRRAICTLKPMSALATMLVMRKAFISVLKPRTLEMSLVALRAALSASLSDLEPMTIILPEAKHRTVHLGMVLRMITAGNRLWLYREPSIFSAITFRFSFPSISISANDTTFCTSGSISSDFLLSRRLRMCLYIWLVRPAPPPAPQTPLLYKPANKPQCLPLSLILLVATPQLYPACCPIVRNPFLQDAEPLALAQFSLRNILAGSFAVESWSLQSWRLGDLRQDDLGAVVE